MLILHTTTDARPQDQLETIAAVAEIARCYPVRSYAIPPKDDSAYWRFLLRNWGKDQIVIIEQDIVPTVDRVYELIDCQDDACTVPYDMRPGVKGGSLFYAKGYLADGMAEGLTMYKEPFPTYSEGSGFGFVKLNSALQRKIPLHKYPVDAYKWSCIDSWVSAYMQRVLDVKWHVHLPKVKHNHRQSRPLTDGERRLAVIGWEREEFTPFEKAAIRRFLQTGDNEYVPQQYKLATMRRVLEDDAE
jgi:hypothetical protein